MPEITTFLCCIVLLIIGGIDYKTHRIPNSLLFLLLACGFGGICIRSGSITEALFSMLIVGIPFLLLATYSGVAIGGGDVKLYAVAAFCFGAIPALSLLIITVLLMLIVSKLFHKDILPMAPFFAVCSLLLLIF